jgi:hypothetical protein
MENNNSNSGIGFFGLLTIAFIVLKLCSVINWSWFWVLSPTLIPFSLLIVLVTIDALLWPEKNNKKSKWEERIEQMKSNKEVMHN